MAALLHRIQGYKLAIKGATTKSIDKFSDLKRRLCFLLLALIVYRIGAHVPVPGIDAITLKELFVIFGPNMSYMNDEQENQKNDIKKELENLKKLSKEKKTSKFSLLKSLFLEKVLLKNKKKNQNIKKEKPSYSENDKLIYEVFRNIKVENENETN